MQGLRIYLLASILEKLLVISIIVIGVSYIIGTDTEHWLSSYLCMPDNTLRNVVVVCSAIITVTYILFAYKVQFDLKSTFDAKLGKGFADTLSIVFVLCAICHAIHGYAYIDERLKEYLFIFYPLLVYAHLKLILISHVTIAHLASMRSEEEYQELVAENKELKELSEWMETQIKKVSSEFEYKKDVTFDKIVTSFDLHQWYEIAPGVDIKLIEKSKDKYKIICKMNGTLVDHFHSDVDETFDVIRGYIYDNISGDRINEDDEPYVFLRNVSHEPTTDVDTIILITGTKV